MQSGLVDILISLTSPLSLYSLATLKSSTCLSLSIAVKLPPKKAISTSTSGLIVARQSSIISLALSPVISVDIPVIFFWLQNIQSWGHPWWGTNMGIIFLPLIYSSPILTRASLAASFSASFLFFPLPIPIVS